MLNKRPGPNKRPGWKNFLEINKRPGVLFSKKVPNKGVQGGILIRDYYNVHGRLFGTLEYVTRNGQNLRQLVFFRQ